LRDRYGAAFREWLVTRDERELGIAYALGREAVSARMSVMELAEAHHRATREALRELDEPGARAAVLDAGAAFLREALSTFEIAHRGYLEMQQVARVEHEHVMQLRALADASVRINGAASTEATLQHTADAACEVLGVRHATVSSTAGDPFARVLSATAPPGGAGDSDLGAPLGVVLRSAGRPVGMLEVRDVTGRRFTERDEAILAQLGQLAAVAIAKSEAYSRERHIAQVLQRSLLPPALPHVPGLSVAVRFIAAGEGIEVGGDFYDFFAPRPGRAAALIGDVCGKGPEAASVTSLARHTLRAAAAYEPRPSAVLQLLHRALRAARDDGRFCTVAYAELEPHLEGARMTLGCGGHPLPLVLRRGGLVEPVGRLGTLLGADVHPRAHRRGGQARARRARRALHGRRHGDPRRPARDLRYRDLAQVVAGLYRRARGRSSHSACRTRSSTRPGAGRGTTSRSSWSARARDADMPPIEEDPDGGP
jgi:hypothetical protein